MMAYSSAGHMHCRHDNIKKKFGLCQFRCTVLTVGSRSAVIQCLESSEQQSTYKCPVRAPSIAEASDLRV